MFCEDFQENAFSLVIGDTLNKTFEINGVDNFLIKSVHFICNDLKINQSLSKKEGDNNDWLLFIPSQITKDFTPKSTDYDIKIIFIDDSLYTATYRKKFNIKLNKNHYESGD